MSCIVAVKYGRLKSGDGRIDCFCVGMVVDFKYFVERGKVVFDEATELCLVDMFDGVRRIAVRRVM